MKRKFNKFISISISLFIFAHFTFGCNPFSSTEYKNSQNLNKDEILAVISILKQTYEKAFDMHRSGLSGVYQRVKVNYHPRTEKQLRPPIEALSYSYGIMNITTVSEFDDLIENKLKPTLKSLGVPLVYDEGRVSMVSIHDYEVISVAPSLIVVPLSIKISTIAKATSVSDALSYVAETGQIDQANSLITKGADINTRDEKGRTPLHLATSQGHKDMCDLLLQNGAEINSKTKQGLTPLHFAAFKGHLNVVKFLIENGSDINAQTKLGDTPLFTAIDQPLDKPLSSSHLDIVKLLINRGAKLDIKRKDGSTALHFSILYKLTEVSELLISSGSNVNQKGKNLSTPLHIAIMSGDLNLIKLLFSKGAKVNITNKDGDTPLHLACLMHYPNITEIVNLLISQGANVNINAKDGSTPLHFAALEGNKAIAESLISHGAKIGAKRNDGSTPLDLARKYGHKELISLLEMKNK